MSIWDKFPNLTRTELRALTAVTCQELLATDDGQQLFPPEFLEISPEAAAKQLAVLANADACNELRDALEDEDDSREICIKVLDEVRKTPVLSERVATAFDAAQHTMSGELLLLVGALAILAIKIKHLRWDESGIDVKFYESSDAVKALISALTFKT